MTVEKDIELLESYILGKLSEEEATGVERRLAEEPDLNALLSDLKILVAAVRHESRNDLANELRQIEGSMPLAPTAYDPKTRRLWAIGLAATILLLISLLYYFNRQQPGPNEKLFTASFTPYPNIFAPPSRGSGDSQALGFRYYDEKNYAGAIAEFNKISDKDGVVHFYLGNAFLADDQAVEALDHFEWCVKEGVFPSQSGWYLALCYLKLGRHTEAISYLEGISTSTSTYANAATQMLAELKGE